MAKGNKTISVKWLASRYNALLAKPETSLEERMLICTLIEDLLMSSKNYNGFGYLYGEFETVEDSPYRTVDEYRRYYFCTA